MRGVTSGLIAALVSALIAIPTRALRAETDGEVQRIITHHVETILPADEAAGVVVAMLIEGRVQFFNYGWAELTARRPVTTDSLFNLASLRKVFETTLLAQAVKQGELALDDPAATHVVELQQGGDIRRVTLGQLASHTSGLLLPQDHPPWPDWGYTLPQFIRTLNAWKADRQHAPGRQHIYTHGGFVLLQLALERRLGAPIDELIEQRILRPLGMASTTLPRRDDSARGRLSPEHQRRAVQGYEEDGVPVGEPGDQQGYYHWPGTSQMYSSVRDMAVFLAANLGAMAVDRSLREGMELTHRGAFTISPRNLQALAWEINHGDEPTIVEKYGGLNNASAYIGMVPSRKLGIVILANRGNLYPNEVGRRILLELARHRATGMAEGGGGN